MALPLTIAFAQFEAGQSSSKATLGDTPPVPEPARGPDDEKGPGDEGEMRPLASFMPGVNVEHGNLHDLMSVRVWRNHVLWRAGIIEGVTSGSLNFISGLMVATLSTWSRTALPPAIFIGNTVIVSTLISSTAMATGAHINPIVTMSTAFSGLCHPVRAIIYIFCQLVGGGLGGSVLRVALGDTLAYKIHNGGCWIDPEGEVGVWQAALIEFTCAFILLFLAYGVGLDPCQAKMFGPKYGPVLVGLTVGIITSITATVHVGYTGAGIFPGRCFGLAVGIGEFQTSHWVWWIPDIIAAAVHGLLYVVIPPYMKPVPARPGPVGVGIREV